MLDEFSRQALRAYYSQWRNIAIKSRIHEDDVAGVIFMDEKQVQFITKEPAKEINWLGLNREMSNY